MTNKERLLSNDTALAEARVYVKREPDYDEDLDGYTYECGSTDWFVAPDGSEFWQFEEAVRYTVRWLNTKE